MVPQGAAAARIARQRLRVPRVDERLGAAVGIARAPAHCAPARLPDRQSEILTVPTLGERSERDHVRELGHRRQVAERHQAREAERVELVAGQQAEVGLRWAHDAGVP